MLKNILRKVGYGMIVLGSFIAGREYTKTGNFDTDVVLGVLMLVLCGVLFVIISKRK